jgi:hypothetical protein
MEEAKKIGLISGLDNQIRNGPIRPFCDAKMLPLLTDLSPLLAIPYMERTNKLFFLFNSEPGNQGF